MIDAVVDKIAGLSIAHRLADDARDRRCRGRNQESAWLGHDLNVLGEETVDFSIDLFGQKTDGLDVAVVMSREASSDIEDFDFMASAARFIHHCRSHIQRLDEVLEISALAANVETQSF